MDRKLIIEVHHSVPRSMTMMQHLSQLFAFDFLTRNTLVWQYVARNSSGREPRPRYVSFNIMRVWFENVNSRPF